MESIVAVKLRIHLGVRRNEADSSPSSSADAPPRQASLHMAYSPSSFLRSFAGSDFLELGGKHDILHSRASYIIRHHQWKRNLELRTLQKFQQTWTLLQALLHHRLTARGS